MKSAFLLCLLASVAFGTTYDLSSLKRTDFGKKLFASIELQLSMEGPVSKVLELLQELDDGLVQEQADHDDRHESYQGECDSTLTEYSNEIDQAEADKSQAESELSVLVPAIAETEKELAEAEYQLEVTVASKEAAIERRSDEHEAYLVRVQEHNDAIEACDLATEQTLELRSSSFLQKPAMLQLSTHLKAIKRVAPGYGGLFKLLLQVAADPQANQEMVTRLINLISKLRASFVSSAELEFDNEAAAQQAHDDLVASLDSTITELTGRIGSLEVELTSLEAQKADSEERKADAEDRIESFTELFEQKKAQCDAEQADYESESERRSSERDTIEEAATLIQNRLGDMSEYVSGKVENVE
jgi:chromosome segregation ATPase